MVPDLHLRGAPRSQLRRLIILIVAFGNDRDGGVDNPIIDVI